MQSQVLRLKKKPKNWYDFQSISIVLISLNVYFLNDSSPKKDKEKHFVLINTYILYVEHFLVACW